MEELKQDIKEIKALVHEIDKKQAVHTHVLNEHHKRSTQLEEQFRPIKKHVDRVEAGLWVLGGASTILAVLKLLEWFLQ